MDSVIDRFRQNPRLRFALLLAVVLVAAAFLFFMSLPEGWTLNLAVLFGVYGLPLLAALALGWLYFSPRVLLGSLVVLVGGVFLFHLIATAKEPGRVMRGSKSEKKPAKDVFVVGRKIEIEPVKIKDYGLAVLVGFHKLRAIPTILFLGFTQDDDLKRAYQAKYELAGMDIEGTADAMTSEARKLLGL